MRPARQPGSSPALRHASAVTSSHELPVSDVTGEHLGNAPDDVITDSDGDRQPLELERYIVRRRIDLFEKQVSNDRLCRTELSVGWVYPRVGLGMGRKFVFSGLGHGSEMADVRKIHV